MKKTLLFAAFLSTVVGMRVCAQAPAKATWQLNTNRSADVSGSITAADQAAPANWSNPTYNKYTTDASNTVYPGVIDTAQRSLPTGGWPAGQQAEDANQWVEYKVSPASGNDLTVNYIKFDFGDMGSTNTGKANIYYSLDNFQTKTQLNGSVLTLPKYSPTEIWLKTEYNDLSIAVPSGSTLSVRVYMYWPNTGSSNITNKSFVNKDVVISGTTKALSTNPLTLLSFQAKALLNQVNLKWTTTNEVNTDNFIVQRKDVNGEFKDQGIVAAANVSGLNSYSFADNSPLGGTNYYRLVQIDRDGSSTYSKVISAELRAEVQFSAFPNPASGSVLTVRHPISSKGRVKVMSLSGNVVITAETAEGAARTTVDISKIPAGTYIVQFADLMNRYTTKLLKQ